MAKIKSEPATADATASAPKTSSEMAKLLELSEKFKSNTEDGNDKAMAPAPQEPVEARPPYNEVPYLNDDITFKDREAELTLLLQLLNFRREAAIRELHYVQRCRDSRYYPGIIHQEPNAGQ